MEPTFREPTFNFASCPGARSNNNNNTNNNNNNNINSNNNNNTIDNNNSNNSDNNINNNSNNNNNLNKYNNSLGKLKTLRLNLRRLNDNSNIPEPEQQNQQASSVPDYTIPGILHYLQWEWQRFELERQEWEIQKAELEARIMLLEGERKGQENLRKDLVRRIKMLEFCLRKERASYHKLKYGVDPPDNGALAEQLNSNSENVLNNEEGENDADNLKDNWVRGRSLLRQYLREVGYMESIIDVRSQRVRFLLGLNDDNSSEECAGERNKSNSTEAKQQIKPAEAEPVVSDAEASVLATFEFLNETSREQPNQNFDDDDSDSTAGWEDEITEVTSLLNRMRHDKKDFGKCRKEGETEEEHHLSYWESSAPKCVDIGELAALTVANESQEINGTNQDEVTNFGEFRKIWAARYSLKSHFDCIRALRFHHIEPLLVTCSEDETLKLWNLNKMQPKQGKQPIVTTFDIEPVHSYRGHSSRVLSLTLIGNTIYSGDQNGELFIWSIPKDATNIDPYDAYDPSYFVGKLEGHTDAIWHLASLTDSSSNTLLCSAGADCTIKIWNTNKKSCVVDLNLKEQGLRPTCLASASSNTTSNSLMVASFSNGVISTYDIETCKTSGPILTFKGTTSANCRVNSIAVHPTIPMIVSAHEDHRIKFWDLVSGECIANMMAHLDEVTSIASDPNGLYLLSGSHDCSVRLWDFINRSCVQDISSHRKKFDEAVLDVAFHPSKPFFASAGADALAKVFE